MTGGFRFKRDDAGIRDVADSPKVGDFLTDKANEARTRIEGYAPHGFMGYAKHVVAIPARRGPDGMEAAVGVDSPVWHLPEYGTARFPARAPIRRGVQDAGIRLEET